MVAVADEFNDGVGLALTVEQADCEAVVQTVPHTVADTLAQADAEREAVGLLLMLKLAEGDEERDRVDDAVCDELCEPHVEADALEQTDADAIALAVDDAVHVDPQACRKAAFCAQPAHMSQ
jgi:hypothetical protein